MMGNGLGQCARGQETSLLYTLFIGEGETVGVNEKKQFFPFNEIPDDTLPHHKVLIAAVGHSFIGGLRNGYFVSIKIAHLEPLPARFFVFTLVLTSTCL